MDHGINATSQAVISPLIKLFLLWAAVALAPCAVAAQGKDAGDAKMISGMSIVGNNEAPKSLFIVPWKSSEIGVETGLSSGLLDDAMRPVDKEVFMREIDFYEIRHAN